MRDPDNGDELVEVDLFSATEIAEMLHVSVEYVRKQVRAGLWPAFRFARRLWFHPQHLERIYEVQTHDPDTLPGWSGTLGQIVDDDDEPEDLK
jgi:hypothetical protein